MSFADLKRSSTSSFDKLTKELEKLNKNIFKDENEDKFWKPTVDKAGNGFSIIRFLPAPEGEDIPFVRTWDHGFQGPSGSWYIENSLTTIGQQDPVSEMNTHLWNSGLESDKEIARKQKRRLSYISNIYVIKDPSNPENEGKVFLYKYGKKIFDKINDMMYPQFEDEAAINPFDLWKGTNFKMKIRNVEGYRNYDKSEFDTPAPLEENDDKLETVWKQEHSLSEIVSSKHFKSYADLKARLQTVLGVSVVSPVATKKRFEEVAQAPIFKTTEPVSQPMADLISEEEDHDLAFFKSLAEED